MTTKLARPFAPSIFDQRQAVRIPRGLSPSRSLAVPSSRIGGSIVWSAANIHVIARFFDENHRLRRCVQMATAPHGIRRTEKSSPR